MVPLKGYWCLPFLPDHRPQLADGDARSPAHGSARAFGFVPISVRTEIRRERTPVLCRKPPRGFADQFGEPALLLLRPRVARFLRNVLSILQPPAPLEMIGDKRTEYPAEVARAGLGIDEHGFGGQELDARFLEDVLGARVTPDALADVPEKSRTERPELEHEFWFGQTTTYGCVLVIHISSL